MSYSDEEKREEFKEFVEGAFGCLVIGLLATAIIGGFYLICTV